MPLYSAFALTIASDLALPELPPGEGDPDVQIRFAPLDHPHSGVDAWSVSARPGEASGWAPGAGRFMVRGGTDIVIDPMPNADDRALRLAVVGPLLGVILTQRSRFVLHASTVAIDDWAVAFAGPSGRGKSTLVAALHDRGYPLIADDMTVIDAQQTPPIVQPGFPRVKLWPDSASALSHDIEELPLIHPERTKRSVASERFHQDALPIARCYLLEDGDAESSAEIAGPEAVLTLIRSTYQASWMHDSGAAGANLVQCAALANSGVVRRLARRRDFSVLPAVLDFIERDVRGRY